MAIKCPKRLLCVKRLTGLFFKPGNGVLSLFGATLVKDIFANKCCMDGEDCVVKEDTDDDISAQVTIRHFGCCGAKDVGPSGRGRRGGGRQNGGYFA